MNFLDRDAQPGHAATIYNGIPAETWQGLTAYVTRGQAPGGFLHAVLANDLFDACGRADEANRRALFAIVSWIWNEAPQACWGSKDAIEHWIDYWNELRGQVKEVQP